MLDTNIIKAMVHGPMTESLRERVASTPIEHLGVSIVTVYEFVRGAFSEINKYANTPRIIGAFSLLDKNIIGLRPYQILPFEQREFDAYLQIPSTVRRGIKWRDAHIAATALASGYTVVTANVKDFRQVEGLAWEDWTARPMEEAIDHEQTTGEPS